MKKTAIILADGFEEIEAITTADVLRRAGIGADLVGLNGRTVTGTHGIPVLADLTFDEADPEKYDMIILPGGLPGATTLRDDPRVQEAVRYFAKAPGKYAAAICAAPICFGAAGVAGGRRVTSYPADDFREALAESVYVDDAAVVTDGSLITSRGPATALKFAFALVDVLGGDSAQLKEDMLFDWR